MCHYIVKSIYCFLVCIFIIACCVAIFYNCIDICHLTVKFAINIFNFAKFGKTFFHPYTLRGNFSNNASTNANITICKTVSIRQTKFPTICHFSNKSARNFSKNFHILVFYCIENCSTAFNCSRVFACNSTNSWTWCVSKHWTREWTIFDCAIVFANKSTNIICITSNSWVCAISINVNCHILKRSIVFVCYCTVPICYCATNQNIFNYCTIRNFSKQSFCCVYCPNCATSNILSIKSTTKFAKYFTRNRNIIHKHIVKIFVCKITCTINSFCRFFCLSI